jgi:hypothetical protein
VVSSAATDDGASAAWGRGAEGQVALKLPVAEDEQRRGLLPLLLLLLLLLLLMMTMILLKREEGCLPKIGAVGRQAAAAAQTRQQVPQPPSLLDLEVLQRRRFTVHRGKVAGQECRDVIAANGVMMGEEVKCVGGHLQLCGIATTASFTTMSALKAGAKKTLAAAWETERNEK